MEIKNIETTPAVEGVQTPTLETPMPGESLQNNLVQENILQNAVQSVQDISGTPVTDDPSVIEEEEIVEEFSEKVEENDKPWVQKVDKVIKDFEHQPYQEEEAAEDLQIGYMKERFNVEIEKKEHQV